MKLFSVFFSLLISSTVFAGWNEDFAELKDIPRSYQDLGAICEEVARVDLKRDYPAPQYTVEVGIAYSDGSRTIGELDIVIFDNNTQKVFKVAEVKCWKDVRGGLKKAKEQRARFMQYIRSGKPLQFVSTGAGKKRYNADQFRYVNEFFSIAQKGSTRQGFDHELEYTLSEMHQYRQVMMRCQHENKCARP